MTQASLPLAGITVIEFTHMVMGPTVGLILADLGAKVIKSGRADIFTTNEPEPIEALPVGQVHIVGA